MIIINNKKRLLRILLSLVAAVISIGLAMEISENYLFDKLIYRKLPNYGYWSESNDFREKKFFLASLMLSSRVKDVKNIEKSYNSGKVLGVSYEGGKRFKVVVIGDSMAYGTGVRTEQRFGYLLQKKLQKLYPVQVYVLALPGDSIVENYTKYLLAKEKIQPDLVIFTVLNNDLIFREPDRYPLNREIYEYLVRNECKNQPLFVYDWKDQNASQEQMMERAYYPSIDENKGNLCVLKTVAKLLAKDPKVMIFSYFPSSADRCRTPDTQSLANLVECKLIQNFLEAGNMVVSPGADFDYQSVSEAEGHPSVQTHEKYAQIIFDEMVSNMRWDSQSDNKNIK